jgi:hypothetical protein
MTVPAQSSGYRTLSIRSRAFRQWFFDQSLSEYETIPTARAFSAILHYLEAQAACDPKTCKIRIPYRIDSRGLSATPERILLDLANSHGQFVDITPVGWTVTSGEGIPFETSASAQSLPAPEPAGHSDPSPDPPTRSPLDTLRSTLNLGAPNSPDWLRCLAWLLAALHPGGPYPILILRGPSGCGKSLAGRILRNLIDPSASPFTPLPSSARELLTLARLNWILAFDHVSSLTPRIVDALCRLSGGVGVAHREPGQREPLQIYIKRPILLTITDSWTPPPDLAARALTVTLPPVAAAARRSEHVLGSVIEQAFPMILGALCTAVSQALASPPEPGSFGTRHAATLAWAQAAAPALNCTAREMRDAFETPPTVHPFVDAVRRLLHGTPHWTGTAAELLVLLPLAQTPRALSTQLHNSILPLADAGIGVQFRRLSGGVRVIHLFASQNLPPSPQPKADKDLAPTPEPPPPSGLCVTNRRKTALRPVQGGAGFSLPIRAKLGRSLPFSASSAPHRVEPVNPPPSIPPVSSPRLSPRLRVSASNPPPVVSQPRRARERSSQARTFSSFSASSAPHRVEPVNPPPSIPPVSSPRLSPRLRVSASNPLPVVSQPHRVRRRSTAPAAPFLWQTSGNFARLGLDSMLTKILFAAAFAAALSAQTAEELVNRNLQAKGGIDKIKALRTLRESGKLQNGGFTAQVGQDSMAPNLLRQTFTVQGMTQIQAYDGTTGWKISPFEGRKDPERLGEDELRDIVEDAIFLGPLVDYQAQGSRVEYIGKDLLDGDDVYRLKVTLKNGDLYYYYLDPETFLEIRVEKVQFIRGAVRESVIECGSYKLVAGVYMPFTYETGSKQSPERTKVTIDKIEPNVTLDPAEFKMPAAGKEL